VDVIVVAVNDHDHVPANDFGGGVEPVPTEMSAEKEAFGWPELAVSPASLSRRR
jgi:hypothetical protein